MNQINRENCAIAFFGTASCLLVSIPWFLQERARGSIHTIYLSMLSNQTDPQSTVRDIHAFAIERFQNEKNITILTFLVCSVSLLSYYQMHRTKRILYQQRGLPLELRPCTELTKSSLIYCLALTLIFGFSGVISLFTAMGMSPNPQP